MTITTAVKSAGEIIAGVTDGSIDLGLVRCPPETLELEMRLIRRERQVLLLRQDHRLAARPAVGLAELGGESLLLHPREANPGHYDAVLGLFRDHGVEPRVRLRTLSFDLRYSPIVQGDAVAIVGESTTSELPGKLRWLPLSPPARLEVCLLARRHNPLSGRGQDAGDGSRDLRRVRLDLAALTNRGRGVMPVRAQKMPARSFTPSSTGPTVAGDGAHAVNEVTTSATTDKR